MCQAALVGLPVTNPSPGRAYVAHGLAAIDCEQLTVAVFTVAQADTAPRGATLDRYFRTTKGMSVNIVPMTVQIVRCYPGVTADNRQAPILPKATALDQASQDLYLVGWQLWNGLQTAKRLGAFAGFCREFAMDPLLPIQPQGGFAGWTIPVEVELGGFDVAFPP